MLIIARFYLKLSKADGSPMAFERLLPLSDFFSKAPVVFRAHFKTFSGRDVVSICVFADCAVCRKAGSECSHAISDPFDPGCGNPLAVTCIKGGDDFVFEKVVKS